jgi:hypothetical protein
VPQDSGCKFLYEHKEATVMSSIYINQLLAVNFTEATAMIISPQLHVLMEASAPLLLSTTRFLLRPWMVARHHIYSKKIDPFDWLTPVRWKGSHEELPRLHLEWPHSGWFRFCQKHGRPTAMPALALNKFDPSVRVLPNLWSVLI